MPTLIINETGKKEEHAHECMGESVTIGRFDDNNIKLPGNGVSRNHAEIIRVGGEFFLLDLGSGNGTMLNGSVVEPNEKHLLRNNDLISIDTYNLRFHSTDEELERSYNEEITDSDILEVKLLKKVLKALDKETVPSIEVLNGSSEGEKIFLSDEVNELVIGRDPACDFSINEFAISRKHAKVGKRWGGIVIRDLESKNGTFINNRRVVEEFLHDGDRIALGTIVLLFRNPQEMNIAQLSEKIVPRNKPADIAQHELETLSDEKSAEIPVPQEKEAETHEEQYEEAEKEEKSKSAKYPLVTPKKSFLSKMTPVEIGMIGLGALVFVFALITMVNLMFE